MRLGFGFSLALKRPVNTRVGEPHSNYVCQKGREKLVMRALPEGSHWAVAQLMSQWGAKFR